MRRLLAILGLVLFACSPSNATTARSSSPGPTAPAISASPSATATRSPSTAPTASPDLPLSRVDLACRLPVITSPVGSTPFVTLQGGFITFPAAQIAKDAAGTMSYRNAEADFATTATPALYGDGFVPFYDKAQSRWVPARARQALADGSAYAYTTYNSQTGLFTAFVVNVASGNSRSFKVPAAPWDPYVADFGPAGVYIASGSALGGPGGGVWLLDPVTGTIKQLRELANVWMVRNGYAWVARFDSRDKTVWAPSELAPANSLVRIDLATGAETIWFYRAGVYPWLIDLDSYGRPVVTMGGNTGNQILLVDRPGSPGQLVYSGTLALDYLQGDGDRLWFGGSRGIYLYRPAQGFQKVFAYSADPATSDRIEPAGFCR
jgi:hypothetical protein